MTEHDDVYPPKVTSDESPIGWGDELDDDGDVQRLLDERPPHHDRD